MNPLPRFPTRPFAWALALSCLFLTGCNLREKAQFLKTMSRVSALKPDLVAALDDMQTHPAEADDASWKAQLDRVLNQAVDDQARHGTPNPYNPALPSVVFGAPVDQPGVVFVDSSHALTDRILIISAKVRYPDTDYLVDITRTLPLDTYYHVENAQQDPYPTDLCAFNHETSTSRSVGMAFHEKDSVEAHFLMSYDQGKAWIQVGGRKVELDLVKEASTPVPDYTTVQVGAQYRRVFKSDDFTAEGQVSIVYRGEADDCVRLEYRLDLILKHGPAARSYTLFNTSGC